MNYVRLAILAGIGIVLGAVVWKINDWRTTAAEVPKLRADIVQAQATLREERRNAKDLRASSAAHQAELEKLKKLAARTPARTVRLCVDADSGMHLSDATGRAAEADAGAGPFPQRAGPDIGGRLYGQADDADLIVAQCRGLLSFVKCKGGDLGSCRPSQ